MRAHVLRRPRPVEEQPLRFEDMPDPDPQPDEIVIEVAACGVCRTDLQQSEGDVPARGLPMVPGHQAVGRVVLIGERVEGWRIGDRAGIGWLASACGDCSFCRTGRENLCERAAFTGWDRFGGYASRVACRADYAFLLPAGSSDLDLAPLLCGGVIGYRALKVSGIQPGGRLGLYGFGASALLSIQVARSWGCEVFVVTRSKDEQSRALDMGAAWAGGYDEKPPVALHAAVTFAPVGSVVVKALRALERGGVVAVNAIHLDEIPAFDYDDLWWERQIRSVANYTRADAREFLALVDEVPVRTTVDRYPFAEAGRALTDLKTGRVHGAAVLEM